MSVASYNTNPALNTSISGIDIAENCAASGYNNALRQIMADIAVWTAAYAVSYPISIANGGTASTTAAAALTALGAFPAAGGTITGATTINANLTRSSSGIRRASRVASRPIGKVSGKRRNRKTKPIRARVSCATNFRRVAKWRRSRLPGGTAG